MEYLEAIAIKRLRPDSLPPNLVHLLDEADRVIKLKQAMCSAGGPRDVFQLPVLSAEQRARVNAVLLCNLAMVCGKLRAWGGPGLAAVPARPIEIQAKELLPGPPRPAGLGDASDPVQRFSV